MKSVLTSFMISASIFAAPLSSHASEETNLACKVQTKRSGWFKTLEQTERRWGISTEAQLAIIADEWGLTAKDLPSIWRPGWSFIGRRAPGLPVGYQDATWNRYKFETGNQSASYKDFSDLSDFIGWYLSSAADIVGLMPGDAAGMYILWKEGPRGYQSRRWLNNTGMIYRSEQFAMRAQEISNGFQTCIEQSHSESSPVTDMSAPSSSINPSENRKVMRPWSWRYREGRID